MLEKGRRRAFSITTNLFSPNEISEILKAPFVLSKAVSLTCGGLCEVAIWSFPLSSQRCRRSPCGYILQRQTSEKPNDSRRVTEPRPCPGQLVRETLVRQTSPNYTSPQARPRGRKMLGSAAEAFENT